MSDKICPTLIYNWFKPTVNKAANMKVDKTEAVLMVAALGLEEEAAAGETVALAEELGAGVITAEELAEGTTPLADADAEPETGLPGLQIAFFTPGQQ